VAGHFTFAPDLLDLLDRRKRTLTGVVGLSYGAVIGLTMEPEVWCGRKINLARNMRDLLLTRKPPAHHRDAIFAKQNRRSGSHATTATWGMPMELCREGLHPVWYRACSRERERVQVAHPMANGSTDPQS
jgi:hypothetical protein